MFECAAAEVAAAGLSASTAASISGVMVPAETDARWARPKSRSATGAAAAAAGAEAGAETDAEADAEADEDVGPLDAEAPVPVPEPAPAPLAAALAAAAACCLSMAEAAAAASVCDSEAAPTGAALPAAMFLTKFFISSDSVVGAIDAR